MTDISGELRWIEFRGIGWYLMDERNFGWVHITDSGMLSVYHNELWLEIKYVSADKMMRDDILKAFS